MAKEQEVVQISQGNEETTRPTTVVGKLQAIFSHGAIFNFGQPYMPNARNKLDTRSLEEVQPTLQGGTILSAHDGGAWIGFRMKRSDGTEQTCKTRNPADAANLKKLMDDPTALRKEKIGKVGINIDPLGGITSV